MKCPNCNSDTPEDSQFCGVCGTFLGAYKVNNSTPQGMEPDGKEETRLVTIPEDALTTIQSQWAYMLHMIPWLVLLGVSLIFDFVTFGIVPTVAATYLIGSRYLSFRRTAYVLTEKHHVIFRGSLISQNRLDVPIADLDNIQIQPGMFGRFLGYTGVRLQLVDQRVILLQYVPITSPLLDHLWVHMNPDLPHEEEPRNNF